MLGCIGVNYNLIKFIKQILVGSNIGLKIIVNYFISSIGGVDMIRCNVANSSKKVTK